MGTLEFFNNSKLLELNLFLKKSVHFLDRFADNRYVTERRD